MPGVAFLFDRELNEQAWATSWDRPQDAITMVVANVPSITFIEGPEPPTVVATREVRYELLIAMRSGDGWAAIYVLR